MIMAMCQFNKSVKKEESLKQHRCSLCENEYAEYLLKAVDYITGDEFHIYRCPQCGVSFTKPELLAEQFKKYYGELYYGKRKSFSERTMNTARIKKIFRLCEGTRGKAVLDIGCGNGSFLSSLQKHGWIIYGTEMSPENHLIDKKISSKIYRRDLPDCRFPDTTFDLITLWHSMEHMEYPRLYLSEIKRILKDDGFLIIEVPNFQSWQSRITKNNWFHLDVPRHLWHYNPRSITMLLNSSGFVVSKISHFSFIYGIFGFTQSILNVFTKRNNILFDLMNGKIKSGNLKDYNISPGDIAITFILFLPVFFLCAAPLFFLESLSKNGGIITIYAKKR